MRTFAILLVLLVAGCVEETPETASQGTEPAPPATPEPVAFRADGLLLDADHDITFDIEPGFTSWSVAIEVAGLEDTPQVFDTDIRYAFWGNTNEGSISVDKEATTGFSTYPETCLVCWEGTTTNGTTGAPWRLILQSNQSIGEYSIRVDVSY